MSRGFNGDNPESKRDINIAEDVVGTVLNKMREEKIIAGSIRNRKNDKMDEEGIDFLVLFETGMAVPIQVKTEPRGYNFNRKFREHIRKHPMIKFMISVPINLLQKEPERLYAIVKKRLIDIFDKFKPRA